MIEPFGHANVKTDRKRDKIDRFAAAIAHTPREFYFPFRDDRVGTVFTPTRRASVANFEGPRIVEGIRISLLVLDKLRIRCGTQCQLVVVTIPTKEFAVRKAVEESGIDVPTAYRKLVSDLQAEPAMRELAQYNGFFRGKEQVCRYRAVVYAAVFDSRLIAR
jgi:hypothetical protein